MSNTQVIEVVEDKEPKVAPALKKAASTTGKGLHFAGAVVADANLRQLGRGFKALGKRLPKVRIEKGS